MKNLLIAAIVCVTFMSGCASVPMMPESATNLAIEFDSPTPGTAGIYVYRSSSPAGGALKKDIWIDNECIGETARGVFFYHEVEGNKEHTISTESEFSPNDLIIKMENGKLYFVEQYIKLGVFVGGAGLEQKDTATGMEAIRNLKMAEKGHCSSER